MTTVRKASHPIALSGVVDVVFSLDARAWYGLRHTDEAVTEYYTSRPELYKALADKAVKWLGVSDAE